MSLVRRAVAPSHRRTVGQGHTGSRGQRLRRADAAGYVAAVTPRAALLHAATLALAGLGFGVYTVVAQARGDATLPFLLVCIALLALAQWLSRRRPSTRVSDLWEWVAATVTFVLVLGGWQLLDATDPTGPDGAPWSLRVVVVVATAVPLAVAGWLALRGSRR
jgi:hypothetical protein